MSFSIQTNNFLFEGDYDIILEGSLNPYLKQSFDIRVSMQLLYYQNTGGPKFKGSIKSPITAYLNKELSISIPKMFDPDDDPFTLSISYPT